ncbi:MAG: Flagellar basal body rod protein FlgB [Candidatus Dichloromethanomonas elyunquensis]|nr:MAG: Flagellar basal body rod protein FlgB [Candidatus Dichloromethanomonas elyunquensis]
MAGWLDSKILTLLEGGLDGLSLRNKVLADNIANVDTPNFKRSDVNFENVLQAALGGEDPGQLELKRTSPLHLSGFAVSGADFVIQDQSTSYRNDGNNVDIDAEMTKLAENTIEYNALTRSLSSHLALLRQVIQS